MKPTTLLFASALALTAVPAFAQGQGDACSGQYSGCMDHCSGRPQSLQESCAQTCENNTNICYEGMYGKTPIGGVPTPRADAPAPSEARDAHGEATGKH